MLSGGQMTRRRIPWLALLAALVLVAAAAAAGAALLSRSDPPAPVLPAPTGPSADVAAAGAVPVQVSVPRHAHPVPTGFLGLSIEFQAIRAYTGHDPAHVNPVLVSLVRNLSPGQAPVLRIGGDSSDASWLPGPGVHRLPYVGYRLTPGWLATTGAVARELGAHMIMGLNLAADQPALAGAEARAELKAFGSQIVAFEIGNEPDVYGKIAELKTRAGKAVKARPKDFGYSAYRRQFAAEAARVPAVALAGPALAAAQTPEPGTWPESMPGFLQSQPRVRIFTLHRYPLKNCYTPRRSLLYPTIPHLLSAYSTVELAAGLNSWIRIAHAQHRLIRVDELNSVACRGRAGVSDTYASSLWMAEVLFQLARAGVDGVNVHTLPDSAYEPFAFSRHGGRFSADVRPVYYGMQLFAQAAPAGSELLDVHGHSGALNAWATRAPDGSLRVALINESPRRGRRVSLRLPPGTSRVGSVIRLRGPGVSARSGVTLGGRSYGTRTFTGRLAPARTQTLSRRNGAYTLSVPRASAALVTFAK
jgi:hypothetical protein